MQCKKIKTKLSRLQVDNRFFTDLQNKNNKNIIIIKNK